MIEDIDTNDDYSNKEIPEGRRKFRVVPGSPRKVGKTYFWKFSYSSDEGEQKDGDIGFFPNTMGELLKALGCKESDKPGKYTLNTDVTDGGEIEATVYVEKGYRRMKEIVGSGVPY